MTENYFAERSAVYNLSVLLKNPVNRYSSYPFQSEQDFNHTPQTHKMGTTILVALSDDETGGCYSLFGAVQLQCPQNNTVIVSDLIVRSN